jgi:hypothetical protein
MPHLINDHSMSQKCITLHLVPLQDFPWYWHAILLCHVSQCGTQLEHALWYPGYHTITSNMITLIFNSTNKEQTVGRPSTPTTFLIHVIFSRLLTMWACAGLGMCVVYFLPIQNRQNQSNTIVSDIHVAPQTAGWYPALRSWIIPSDPALTVSPIGTPCFNCAIMSPVPATCLSWLYSSPQVSASASTK